MKLLLLSTLLSFLVAVPPARLGGSVLPEAALSVEALVEGKQIEPEPVNPDLDRVGTISEEILEGRIPSTDRRYTTFKLAMDIMRARGHKTLVETGTARRGDKNCLGDGCSTVLFSRWAQNFPQATLYSVDNDESAIKEAMMAVYYFNTTSLVNKDSVQFLREFKKPIDFLYLDTLDFDTNYPRPSQEQALREILAAFPKLHEGSMVMVDDCGLAYGGKCALVELFLKEMGWRTLIKSYQLLMVSQGPVIL